MITRIYEYIMRLGVTLPQGWPTLNKERACNRHGTAHIIRLIKELGIVPATLVDVGANNSQWSYWLKREWPNMEVFSFEPLRKFNPIGTVLRTALTDSPQPLALSMHSENAFHIGECGNETVMAMRYDQIKLPIKFPAILKIDCENFTAKALCGFGDTIDDFNVVVVEMWNDIDEPQFINQQHLIWAFMLQHGFHGRLVDFEYGIGKLSNYDVAFYKSTI